MSNNEKFREITKVNVSLSQQIAVSVGGRTSEMKAKNRILEISNQNEAYYLRPDNILYVVADGNYCDIHLTDGDVLETVSFQRAEIARKIDTQLSRDLASNFSLVGKSYLVNIEHIMHINAQHQQLTFDINMPDTCKKKAIKATSNALRNLRQALEETSAAGIMATTSERRVNGGFAQYLSSESAKDVDYEIGDDDVMMLGR